MSHESCAWQAELKLEEEASVVRLKVYLNSSAPFACRNAPPLFRRWRWHVPLLRCARARPCVQTACASWAAPTMRWATSTRRSRAMARCVEVWGGVDRVLSRCWACERGGSAPYASFACTPRAGKPHRPLPCLCPALSHTQKQPPSLLSLNASVPHRPAASTPPYHCRTWASLSGT